MEKFKPYFFWLIALLAPITSVMLTVIFLIIVDFIVGAYAAIKENQPITSKRITTSISKFFIYNLVVLSAFLLEKYIVKEVPFQRIIAGFIAIAEIKSIMGSFNQIYGLNPFAALIKFIKKKSFAELEGTFEELTKDNTQEHKIQKK